jgi:uncharacterized membrane protein YfcA
MSGLEVAAGLAVLAGALLQSAVGFGFSLVCAPLVFAAAGPQEAVGLLTVLGLEVNLVSLIGERRRPVPLLGLVGVILVSSVPGMLAGVAVLRGADAKALQITLTIVVFVSLAVQLSAQRRRAGEPHPGHAWAPPAAGLAAGVLTTTTATAGPPLVLLLLGRGHEPIRVRDTLTTCFACLSIIAGAVLAATGTHRALPDAAALAALVPLAAIGQIAGRRAFHRLAAGSYELVLTLTLTASAIVGLLSALL